MSLVSFIHLLDVRAKLGPLRPKTSRKVSAPLKVEPRTNHHMLLGTAFDYLLRFELQRRAPHAVAERWIAEYVPEKIEQGPIIRIVRKEMVMDEGPDSAGLLEKAAEDARATIDEAKAAVGAYLKSKAPNHAQQVDLAGYAISLAKLDAVFRAWVLDLSFEQAHAADMEDLADMLSIVPFDQLIHPKLMWLNPNFRETSRLVDGADTDLIAGDLLVDFKTTKESEIKARDLDQILGYLLLARKQRQLDPAFPEINRLGFYFCRHGYLWFVQASVWTDRPEFSEIERWFFKRAEEEWPNRERPLK